MEEHDKTDGNVDKLMGISGQFINIKRKPGFQLKLTLDINKIKEQLIEAKKDGINSVAICFLHGYTFKGTSCD